MTASAIQPSSDSSESPRRGLATERQVVRRTGTCSLRILRPLSSQPRAQRMRCVFSRSSRRSTTWCRAAHGSLSLHTMLVVGDELLSGRSHHVAVQRPTHRLPFPMSGAWHCSSLRGIRASGRGRLPGSRTRVGR